MVLTRPYVQVPWGYEWNDEPGPPEGGRVREAAKDFEIGSIQVLEVV